jgi:hypothetical protein
MRRVLPLHRRHKLQAPSQRSRINPGTLCRLRKGHAPPWSIDNPVPALVPRLFDPCRPTAVLGAVRPVVIDAIDGPPRLPGKHHVVTKRLERLPTLAHRDAPGTIVVERRVVGVPTPPPHICPDSVDRVSTHPMRAPEAARYLSNKTTAASAGSAGQGVSADLPLVAAITLRTDVANLLPSGCFPKHYPTPEPGTRHTCLCGNPAQGQPLLSHRLRLPFSARWSGAVPMFTRQPEPSRPSSLLYTQIRLCGDRSLQQIPARWRHRPPPREFDHHAHAFP